MTESLKRKGDDVVDTEHQQCLSNNKRSRGSSAFEDLIINNSDVLRAVLARTSAEDHPSLRATCKAFHSMMASSDFLKERTLLELVEAEARCWTWDQYWDEHFPSCGDEEEDENTMSRGDREWKRREFKSNFEMISRVFGVTGIMCDDNPTIGDFKADILVDGRKEGIIEGQTILRPNSEFHKACDMISGELQFLGCNFCDSEGRVRLKEIKQAMAKYGLPKSHESQLEDLDRIALMEAGEEIDEDLRIRVHDTQCFVYIERVHIEREEYRKFGTKIVADALRSLLSQHKCLWSLAVYIPHETDYLTEEDQHLRLLREIPAGLFPEKEALQRKQAETQWCLKLKAYKTMDMRSFLRAGFRQVRELVEEHEVYAVYAIPAFLEEQAILSHTDTMSIQILEKPAYPPNPTGKDEELLSLFCCSCNDFRDILPQLRQVIESVEKDKNKWNALIDSLRREFESILRPPMHSVEADDAPPDLLEIDDLVKQLDAHSPDLAKKFGSELARLNDVLATIDQKLDSLRTKVRTFFPRLIGNGIELKAKAKALIAEGANVQSSFILHCVASNHIAPYVDLVLDLVPESSRISLLNSLDCDGKTPLMMAAGYIHDGLQEQEETCETLIERGADPDYRSPTGMIAWQCYLEGKQAMDDLENIFQVKRRSKQPISTKMVDLLKPYRWTSESF